MRAAILVLLLSSGVASAQLLPDLEGPIYSTAALMSPSYATPYAFFEFAPESGAGLPSAQTLCSQLSAAEIASGWCLNGDGTSAAGGLTLTAQGAPTDGAATVCPNGASCGEVASRRLNGSAQFYESANVASPTGDFTVCWLGVRDNAAATHELVSKDTAAGVERMLDFRLDTSGSVSVFLFKSGGSTSVAASAAVEAGAPTLVCVAYDYVADGSSVIRVTKNGTYVNGTTTAVGPPQTASSSQWEVGVLQAVASYLPGTVRGAFAVESYFADARVAAIARAVLADTPTGAKGEALTYTRTGARFCDSVADGTAGSAGSILPANRPCVTRGGLLVEASRTNSLVRSSEIDNASWTKGPAVGTVTADYAVAPDGTMTADRYQHSNTNADYVLQGFSVGGLAASTSVYLRGNGADGTIDFCRGGAGGQCVVCAYVAASWTRCVYEGTLAGSSNTFLGCDTATKGGACAGSGFDVLVWGWQGELGAYASSPIPTTSAAGVRGADVPYFAVSTAGVQAQGCARATAALPAGLSQGSLVFFDANGRAIYYSGGQRMYDGTNNPTIAATPDGTFKTYVARWTASTFTGGNSDTAEASSAFDGTMGAAPSTIYVGYSSSNLNIDGVIKGVMVDPNPQRCPAP